MAATIFDTFVLDVVANAGADNPGGSGVITVAAGITVPIDWKRQRVARPAVGQDVVSWTVPFTYNIGTPKLPQRRWGLNWTSKPAGAIDPSGVQVYPYTPEHRFDHDKNPRSPAQIVAPTRVMNGLITGSFSFLHTAGDYHGEISAYQ